MKNETLAAWPPTLAFLTPLAVFLIQLNFIDWPFCMESNLQSRGSNFQTRTQAANDTARFSAGWLRLGNFKKKKRLSWNMTKWNNRFHNILRVLGIICGSNLFMRFHIFVINRYRCQEGEREFWQWNENNIYEDLKREIYQLVASLDCFSLCLSIHFFSPFFICIGRYIHNI